MIALTFSDPPLDIALRHNEIHIWGASLDQPQDLIESLADDLSVDEKNRAKRFHFAHDCRRFIVGRGLLRILLARYLQLKPNRLQFCYGQYGKPFVADFSNKNKLHFNLSHSKGYALFAFTYGCEIGVDIEYIQSFSEMEEIAKQFFSIQEYIIWQALPNREKKATFFNFWTRKEAFAKAVGKGLSYTLNQIDVSQCPGQPCLAMRKSELSENGSLWSIQDLNPMPGFAAAFAVEGRDWRLHCWQLSDYLVEFNRDIQRIKRVALH